MYQLWAAYKIKFALNSHDIFKNFIMREGVIQESGSAEVTLTNVTALPTGYPAQNIEYTVPEDKEFHLLYFKIFAEDANNIITVRNYINGVVKWAYAFAVTEHYLEQHIPYNFKINSSDIVTWTVQQTSVAPARRLRIVFYGVEKNG